MKSEHMLMYVLVFVLGFMVARMMSGQLVEGSRNTLDKATHWGGCLLSAFGSASCKNQGEGDWWS